MGVKMITIDQLLESVDLDFEPRFVTQNKSGTVELWKTKPTKTMGISIGYYRPSGQGRTVAESSGCRGGSVKISKTTGA